MGDRHIGVAAMTSAVLVYVAAATLPCVTAVLAIARGVGG